MTQNSINNTASILQIDNLNLNGNTLSSTDTNGNVVVDPNGTGTLVSGKGISFDTGTNTLAAYETGLWTPTIEFGGASVGMTYANQQGKYERVGNIVFVNIQVTLTAKGTSTGDARLLGVPFSNSATVPTVCQIFFTPQDMNLAVGEVVYLDIGGGSSAFNIRLSTITTVAEMNETDFNNDSRIRATGFYYTDA